MKYIGKDEDVREAIGLFDKLIKKQEKEYAQAFAEKEEEPKKKPLYFRGQFGTVLQ